MSRSRFIALAAVAALFASAVGASVVACTDPTYPFLGRRYFPERDCLESTRVVDILRGGDPGNCAPTCLSVKAKDDAGAPIDVLFVTVMCAPFPPESKVAPGPLCTDALEALDRKDTCLRDGGSSAPAADAGTDGGSDGGTSSDAGEDAALPEDASTEAGDASTDGPLDALDAATDA